MQTEERGFRFPFLLPLGNRILPLFQCVEVHPPHLATGEFFDLSALLRRQNDAVNARQAGDDPAERGADLARFVRYLVGFLFDKFGMRTHPA